MRQAPRLFMLLLAVALSIAGSFLPLASTAQEANGTLTLRFVGCPDGAGDESGPPDDCTTAVDAPADAKILVADATYVTVADHATSTQGTYEIPMSELQGRDNDNVSMYAFDSDNYNYYTFDGVSEIALWRGSVNVQDGDQNVTVTYWNGPGGLITPAENTLIINQFTCKKNVDPDRDPKKCDRLKDDFNGVKIEAGPETEADVFSNPTMENGTLTYAKLPAYTRATVGVTEVAPGYTQYLITGQADTWGEDTGTAYLLRNEKREINVYYYGPDGSATNSRGRDTAPGQQKKKTPESHTNANATSAPTSAPTATTAPTQPAAKTQLRVFLLSCPAGVSPHSDASKCTETIASDDQAQVKLPDGTTKPLNGFERDGDGAYLIPTTAGDVTLMGITPVNRDKMATDADRIDGSSVVYSVKDGQSRDAHLYYFDE